MAAYEEFVEMVDEILLTLPETFFRELNGGVNVKEGCKIHPEAVNGDLVILGEYHTNSYLGHFINLYYGSFEKLFSHLDRENLKKRVRKTILHEFRHHLETLAGEKDLVIEDAIQLADYRRVHGLDGDQEKNRD